MYYIHLNIHFLHDIEIVTCVVSLKIFFLPVNVIAKKNILIFQRHARLVLQINDIYYFYTYKGPHHLLKVMLLCNAQICVYNLAYGMQ